MKSLTTKPKISSHQQELFDTVLNEMMNLGYLYASKTSNDFVILDYRD